MRRKKSNLLESFPECTNIKKRISENRQKEKCAGFWAERRQGILNKILWNSKRFFCLTKRWNRGIIIKLSDESTELNSLKSTQNREKRIAWGRDLRERFQSKSEPEAGRETQSRGEWRWSALVKRSPEKTWKSLKKGLTNFRKCGIINKSLDEVDASKLPKTTKTASWKLNNARKEKARKTGTLVDSMNQYEKSDKTIKHNSNCERFAMNQISNRSKIWLEIQLYEEFDPGSGRTLAARLTHASRTVIWELASKS